MKTIGRDWFADGFSAHFQALEPGSREMGHDPKRVQSLGAPSFVG